MTVLLKHFRPRRTGGRRIAWLVLLFFASFRGTAHAESLYSHAWYAPSDVTMSIHVEDGAALRKDLANRPIAEIWKRTLAKRVGPAWSALARSTGTSEAALFDRLLGRRCSLFFTGPASDRDWALVTEVDPADVRPIIRALNPEVRPPVEGLRAGEIPEHDVRYAALGTTILVGPRAGTLLDAMAHRMANGPIPSQPALGDMPWMDQARSLEPARVGVYVRHDDALGGGWSVFTGAIAGNRVRIRHGARFEVSPFARPRTNLTWDMSPLLAVERSAVLAVIEPTDIGGGPWIRFVETMLDEPLLTAAMRRNMDECMMVSVAEVEGRQEPHRTDMLLPAAALVIKVKNGASAKQELDECVMRVVSAADRLTEGPFVREMPVLGAIGPRYRHLDLEPGMTQVTQGFPVLRSVSLDWTVARGPIGDFYVLATHADHLRATATALETAVSAPAYRGAFTSCGTMDGVAVGRQLESYGEQAVLFTADDPDSREAFRETMKDFGALARGIDRCRWRLLRPSELETDLRLELTLRPAPSVQAPAGIMRDRDE